VITTPRSVVCVPRITFAVALALGCQTLAFADSLTFTAGDLVVSAEGDGISGNTYTDGQAAPITLYQFSLNGTTAASAAGATMLPTTSSGANSVISGEYGSSSEGALQLSGNGQYLAIMGYGVSTTAFNANPTVYGTSINSPGSVALGQSGSLLNAAPRTTFSPTPRRSMSRTAATGSRLPPAASSVMAACRSGSTARLMARARGRWSTRSPPAWGS
jgi:hypothetical protein